MRFERITPVIGIVFLVFSPALLTSCHRSSMEGLIITTMVSGTPSDIAVNTSDPCGFITSSQLVATDPSKQGSSRILTELFYSASSPFVDYEGRHLLFAAVREKGDPWQIWEMDLSNMKSRRITFSDDNCTNPAYLPDGRLVFSKMTNRPGRDPEHLLYTCNEDGSEERQITFHPRAYFATTILKDGRIMAVSHRVFPSQGEDMILVIRPDGTKTELFYQGKEGSIILSRGWETDEGEILFVESPGGDPAAGELVSVSYNRPLHTRLNLSAGTGGDFRSVWPLKSGKLLVSYRSAAEERYILCEFDTENKTFGRTIFEYPDHDLVDAIIIGRHSRPKKLPSEVDFGVRTGLLLCQNINFFGLPNKQDSLPRPEAHLVEVLGVDSLLGFFEVEKDGSFYLKIIADTPFRLQTLDKNGNILYGPCDWIYLRPNERRGCIGCHEDHELAPENRFCIAVRNLPIPIPAEITGLKEKEIKLE